MKKFLKFLLVVFIIAVVLFAALMGLIYYDEKVNPPLTEDQVKAMIVEQVEPQLKEISDKSGIEINDLEIEFDEYEYHAASIFGDGLINITLSETYVGGPFEELEKEIYNDEVYNKYDDIDRVDYSNVVLDKYELYINRDTSISYLDNKGNLYHLTMGVFSKNGEAKALVGSLGETVERVGELLIKHGGAFSAGVSDKNNYDYDSPKKGESFPDYMKRVDPELYEAVCDNYDKAMKDYKKN